MKKLNTYLLLIFVTFFSPLLLAHPGHGDHTALLAEGQIHPMLSGEHVLMLSAVVAVVYLALKQIRK